MPARYNPSGHGSFIDQGPAIRSRACGRHADVQRRRGFGWHRPAVGCTTDDRGSCTIIRVGDRPCTRRSAGDGRGSDRRPATRRVDAARGRCPPADRLPRLRPRRPAGQERREPAGRPPEGHALGTPGGIRHRFESLSNLATPSSSSMSRRTSSPGRPPPSPWRSRRCRSAAHSSSTAITAARSRSFTRHSKGPRVGSRASKAPPGSAARARQRRRDAETRGSIPSSGPPRRARRTGPSSGRSAGARPSTTCRGYSGRFPRRRPTS